MYFDIKEASFVLLSNTYMFDLSKEMPFRKMVLNWNIYISLKINFLWWYNKIHKDRKINANNYESHHNFYYDILILVHIEKLLYKGEYCECEWHNCDVWLYEKR